MTESESGSRGARFASPFDLTGRVAVVTGAGSESGIGFAVASLLAGLGASVLLGATTDRVLDRQRDLERLGFDATGVVADLTTEVGAQRLADAAAHRFGRVDILVNNAGMVSIANPADGEADGPLESGLIETMRLDSWRAAVSRNLDTAFLATRAVLPLMPGGQGRSADTSERSAGGGSGVETGDGTGTGAGSSGADGGTRTGGAGAGTGSRVSPGGRIIMVASVTGPVMAMRAEPGYAAAKAGMVGLARSLAVDLAARGITVNAVAPGWIGTGSQTDDEREQGIRTPLGRSATAAEVAAPIAFLASPGASYITGQVIVIDGGNSIAEERA